MSSIYRIILSISVSSSDLTSKHQNNNAKSTAITKLMVYLERLLNDFFSFH